MTTVALLGMGEVGTVLAEDLGALPGVRLAAWDVAFNDSASAPARNASALGVPACAGAVEAVRDADLVISAVTAANDVAAAEAAASGVPPGCWFLDLNSAAPGRKQAAAGLIENAGGRYVEAAVMSPIMPKRLAAPMLLGGRHASDFAAYAPSLGFTGLAAYAETVGPASATKLCRSVVIKGVEALLTESMLKARSWGVEAHVLASLTNLLPADDWERLAAYMISRSLEHGTRRAEEMREAAATVAAAGVSPVMSEATARRQDWAAAHHDAVAESSLAALLDAIRVRLPGHDQKGID
jgi:3-hydroxyisobutyrate dehydrogenase-like beta-hydroxyacid dehydrogenase